MLEHSLVSSSCLWKTNLFFSVLLCHHEKCWGFGLFVRTLPFFGSWLSHYLIFGFSLLKWDKSLSICVLYIILLFVLCFVHSLNFGVNLVLIWFFDMIWTNFWHVTLLCVILFYFVFCLNHISIWFLKVLHAYLLYVYPMACLLSLIQYIG